MHTCDQCYGLCFCDRDDLEVPQPIDCRHVCEEPDELEWCAEDDEEEDVA